MARRRDRGGGRRRWSARCGGDDRTRRSSPTRAYGEPAELRLHPHRRPEPTQFNRRYMPGHGKLIADPGTEFTELLRRDAALLPVAGGDAHRPVRPQQRRAHNVPGYGPCSTSPRTSSRPGCSAPATRPPRSGKWLNGYEKTVADKDEVAAGLGQVARPGRRPRLLPLQAPSQQAAQEGLPPAVHHRLDRRDRRSS